MTEYFLYDKRVKDDFSICILSDLHFSTSIDDDKLKRILKEIENISPQYLFFPGDIVDSLDEIEDEKAAQRLAQWFSELAQKSHVIVSLGNHDFYRSMVLEGRMKRTAIHPKRLIELLEGIENLEVLDNENYEDDKIFAIGYTQSPDYYQKEPSKNLGAHLKEENMAVMENELKKLRRRFDTIPKNKISFLLVHSPCFLDNSKLDFYLKDFDFYISGHMHNGCVPPILYELWPSTRGIISPAKSWFPKNERNTLRKKGDKLIVNGPLTTFQKCSGKFQNFNFLFPTYLSIIHFSNNPKNDLFKIKRKSRYHN